MLGLVLQGLGQRVESALPRGELTRAGHLDPLDANTAAAAAAAIGADRHQRTDQRRGHRNGSRDRLLATPAGDIQLRIPRFRTGRFFSSLL